MPVGIVGAGEDIVIQLAFVHYLCVPAEVTVAGVGEVVSYEDIPVKVTHSLFSA